MMFHQPVESAVTKYSETLLKGPLQIKFKIEEMIIVHTINVGCRVTQFWQAV
jgi:hypothetical protein